METLFIFSFEGDGSLWQSEGGYTDYVNHKREISSDSDRSKAEGRDTVAGRAYSKAVGQNSDEDISSNKADWKSGHQKKLKFTWQEQKDYETIEEDIAKLEEKMDRWMYLEELAARIAEQ